LQRAENALITGAKRILGALHLDGGRLSGLSNCGYLPEETTTLGKEWAPRHNEFGQLSALEYAIRFRSLTDLKWGEFETMGFGVGADETKLQFDLTESARTVGLRLLCFVSAWDLTTHYLSGSYSEASYSHLERFL